MNQALSALYALQQVDSALALAQRQYRALDPGRAEQVAAEEARAEFDKTSRVHHETARDLHDAELELKSVETKKKDFETKLYSGKVHAFKELESMQQEIEALGRQRGRLDERILTLMDDIELRQAEEQEKKAKLQAAETALAEKQAQYKKDVRRLTAQIQALTAERAEKAALISAALLKRYEAIRAAHGGVGIARIEDGMCAACHTSLPVNLVRLVEETDSVGTCENCGRLLCNEQVLRPRANAEG
jgi:predicted  nucleic acid-binding Zn-ribbon protein